MNISDLLKKENRYFNSYFDSDVNWFDFSGKNLISLEGLPDDFNHTITVSGNKLKNIKGLPKNFNSTIWIYGNNIKNLDGLNNCLEPKNIHGLNRDFIAKEYKRLGKSYLLI